MRVILEKEKKSQINQVYSPIIKQIQLDLIYYELAIITYMDKIHNFLVIQTSSYLCNDVLYVFSFL